MASITTWTRLEPRSRRDSLERGLQAAVHDPLWLLARQWQLGEFNGEDAGSPVVARLQIESASVTKVAIGPEGRSRDFHGEAAPLDVVVEAEAVRGSDGGTLRERVEAGLDLLRRLQARRVSRAVRSAIAAAAPLRPPTGEELAALDTGTLRFLRIMAGRVPDGGALARQVRRATPAGSTHPRLPSEWRVPRANRASVREVVEEWLRALESLMQEGRPRGSAWIPERLEYDFRLAARAAEGEVVLRAREFDGGGLDWHAFDVEPGASLGANVTRQPHVDMSVPAPATFRGMPASRWWEFEDSQVDLGGIAAEPEDLPRLLLIEFAVAYGNDWFIVPVDLECGSIGRVGWLIVADTFGIRTSIPHYAETRRDATWSMWANAGARQGADVPRWLFLPPVAARTMDSAPLEDVSFVRDEIANVAWAIERVVESASGRPLDRARDLQERAELRRDPARDGPPPASGVLSYKLASHPPANWIPFLPERTEPPAIRLRRGALAVDSGAPAEGPRSRLLGDANAGTTWLFEEEVPRAGVRVVRRLRYTRWTDGSTHLWVAKRKTVGRGEGSSGLRFDHVVLAPK